MDDAAVTEVAKWMPQFRNTNGLIIDVRQNGGGTRDGLRALFPYLMSETDAPRVINIYRLPIMLTGPNGKAVSLVTVWIVAVAEFRPRLVTLFPGE